MGVLASGPLWWGDDWASALLAIATSLLALGVVITVFGLRSARTATLESAKARNTQVYAEISRRWDTDDLLQVRAKIDRMEPRQFMDLYASLRTSKQKSRRSESFKLKRLANFFEDLGVLECRGSLDIEWVEVAFGSLVTRYWEIWKLAAIEERKSQSPGQSDDSLIWENWESLSKKMEQRRIRRQGHHPKRRWHRRKHF